MAVEHQHLEAFCPYCRQRRLHIRLVKRSSASLHLLLTLFTCGWWLLVWLLCDVANGLANRAEPYRCAVCGAGNVPAPSILGRVLVLGLACAGFLGLFVLSLLVLGQADDRPGGSPPAGRQAPLAQGPRQSITGEHEVGSRPPNISRKRRPPRQGITSEDELGPQEPIRPARKTGNGLSPESIPQTRPAETVEEARQRLEAAIEQTARSNDGEPESQAAQQPPPEEPPAASRPRMWHDAQGRPLGEAQYRGRVRGVVLLRREDGTIMRVPESLLSPEDLLWIESVRP